MKVWITKYALTKGILEVNGRVGDYHRNMLAYKRTPTSSIEYVHGDGRNWHRTFESAVARANAMRDAKIKAHERAIARLKTMQFGAHDKTPSKI